MNFKNDFKKWLSNQEQYNYDTLDIECFNAPNAMDHEIYWFVVFDKLPFYFKYGVYIQFFESKGMYPYVQPSFSLGNGDRIFNVFLDNKFIEPFNTMELAMDRAIEEAVKFYNRI
jgi:hypothetical protein